MMTMTKIGTGTTENGQVPNPFSKEITELNKLVDLQARFRVLSVALVIGLMYSTFVLMVFEFTPIDLVVIGLTTFLGYRTVKLGDEIQEIKQYLHGEEVPALD